MAIENLSHICIVQDTDYQLNIRAIYKGVIIIHDFQA